MRAAKLVLCLLLVFSGPQVFAEPAAEPAEVATAFYEHIVSMDFVAAADMFDPKSLSNFRDLLRIVYEDPSAADVRQLKTLFGPEATAESINAMSDAEFFSTFLKMIFQQLQIPGAVSLEGVEVIGSVPEDSDKAHVVIRQAIGLGETSVEMMDVVSMQLVEGQWKLTMKGDMESLAAAIRQAYQ